MMKKTGLIIMMLLFSVLLTSCSPEVGSEKWCKAMKEKDKGEWTANEAKDYVKHCVFD